MNQPGAALLLLHVDAAIVVAEKPAGLPAVPGRGAALQDCLSARVQALVADARVVHRLDMATSGLMLFARGAQVQQQLSAAFAMRRVSKTYVAVVHGVLGADCGEIELPLRADWPNRPRQIVDPDHGKPSLTRWRVLARDPQAQTTRVELEPVSGRTHQLRVHLAAIGHPVIGDTLYAPDPDGDAAPRLLLHACALGFHHPMGGEWVGFSSEASF